MKNIPEKIYLQIDADGETPEDFNDMLVSWCKDKIFDTDIEYVLPSAVTGGVKDEIIKLQDEYIEFLDRESSPFISFAFTHNMVVPEKVVNEGKTYREKISLAKLKQKLSEGQPE